MELSSLRNRQAVYGGLLSTEGQNGNDNGDGGGTGEGLEWPCLRCADAR